MVFMCGRLGKCALALNEHYNSNKETHASVLLLHIVEINVAVVDRVTIYNIPNMSICMLSIVNPVFKVGGCAKNYHVK
jgi:hypothetical protein